MTLKEALQKLAEKQGHAENILCKVKDVDTADFTCTCEPLNGTAPFFKVRLKAENTNGNLIVPKKYSTVIVSMIDSGNAYVSLFSEVEYFLFTAENSTLKIEKDKITMNGGGLGGLTKTQELKTQLEKLTARVDDIISAINNGVPTTGAADGGAALHTSIKTGLALIINKENFSSIENTKIKHG